MGAIEQEISTLREFMPLLSALAEKISDPELMLELLGAFPPPAAQVFNALIQATEPEYQAWHAQVHSQDPELADLTGEILLLARSDLLPVHPSEAGKLAVFRFWERITEVDSSAHISFEIENPRPILRLFFFSGDQSDQLIFTSDQDLEDALYLGKSIALAVDEALEQCHANGIPLRSEQFGDDFGPILDDLESLLRSLRKAHKKAVES